MQLRLAAEGVHRQLHGRGTGDEEAEDRQRCGALVVVGCNAMSLTIFLTPSFHNAGR